METICLFQGAYPAESDLREPQGIEKILVQDGNHDILPFLHDVTLASYDGRIYEAWYNSTNAEICGSSLIRGRFSADEGKTWSEPYTIAGEIGDNEEHFVPADFFVHQNRLCALITTMSGKNITHSVELYRLAPGSKDCWEHVSKIAEGFICNTTPQALPDGSLIVGAWMPMKEETPAFPVALISQGAEIEKPWRCVFLYDPLRPGAIRPLCPETTIDVEGNRCTALIRNDESRCYVLFSEDCGQTWRGPFLNDMPINGSKMYAGKLSDGRHFLIYNQERGRWVRTLLLLAIAEKGEKKYSKIYKLFDGHDAVLNKGKLWNYPSACEMNGKLFIGCTLQETTDVRCAILCSIPVKQL